MTDRTEEKHTGINRVMDKAADMAGGIVGRTEAKLAGSNDAEAFVRSAAIGDMYEIEAGKMARERARSDEVRAAAQQMVDDHTASTHQLKSALMMNETPDIDLPNEVDNRRQGMLDHLEAAPEDQFDEMYIEQQVMAHKETVDLMTGYRDKGENPQLRSHAEATAPVVERHLKRMQQLQSEHA